MTQNQINYWNLKESQRHNYISETETNRHNVATEGIDLGKLNETVRHNKVSEGQTDRSLGIESGKLDETKRHNLQTERQADVNLGIQAGSLQETKRHNQASEALTGADLNIRSGQLAETNRHNVVTEALSKIQTVSQAELNEANAALANVRSTWEAIKSNADVQLSGAKQREINALIQKMEDERALLQSQKRRSDFGVFWDFYDRALETFDRINSMFGGQ